MNFLVLVGGGAQVLEQPLEFGLSSAEVAKGLGVGVGRVSHCIQEPHWLQGGD